MIRVCAVQDVGKGEVVAANAGGTPVAVVHTDDGTFFAIYDECSHAQIALSEGEVDGCTLECWLHGSRFDLRTGQPTGLPATEPVPVYPVEIRDGDVYVDLNPSNGVHT
jgi:3-phenylpropionate/trans-cinnamate dioxygenase ferredoxin subunit